MDKSKMITSEVIIARRRFNKNKMSRLIHDRYLYLRLNVFIHVHLRSEK